MVNIYALSAIAHLLVKEVEIFTLALIKLEETNARITQNALKPYHERHCQPNHTPDHISSVVAEVDVSLSQDNNNQILPTCKGGDD